MMHNMPYIRRVFEYVCVCVCVCVDGYFCIDFV